MIVAALALVALGLTVSLLLAPIEALGWWAGWFGEEDAPRQHVPSAAEGADLYVVYLDGIAKAGHVNYRDVQGFLDRLARALPGAAVLGDVMPYSPTRRDLTEGRPLARFWRRMLDLKLRGRQPVLTFTINVRNLLQVLVASDRRYAALYGKAAADAIVDALVARGYEPRGGAPVALVGYSGGAQVALVAAPYLRRQLGAPLYLVSLAGVMADEPGMLELERVLHIESRRDRIPRVGRLAFPGLWGIWPRSRFGRLRRSGRFETVDPGPMRHNGPESYLDDEAFIGGRSHQEVTTAIVARFLEACAREHGSARPGLTVTD
ncbi:MAG TPA: hypothetical protein VKY42_08655 [Trueperaceae bacterium]|nr:hypothetical protein [Trueperaceae bacterium]